MRQIASTQYAKSDYLVSLQRYQDALGVLDAMQKSDVLAEKIRFGKYEWRILTINNGEALQVFSDDADRKPNELSPGVEANWAWLRSSDGERTFAAIIEKSGKVSAGGSRITTVHGGIGPAIFIKL